jgi:OmpA-OmpF porin, OOP family
MTHSNEQEALNRRAAQRPESEDRNVAEVRWRLRIASSGGQIQTSRTDVPIGGTATIRACNGTWTGWSMRTTKRFMGSLAALAFLAAGIAEAKPQGAGVFFGIGGGSSTYDQDKGDFDLISRDAFGGAGLPIVSLQSELDDSDTTLSVFGGYRFTRYISVEAGYLDLGDLTYNGNATFRRNFFSIVPGSVRLTANTKGGYVTALGSLPITGVWEIYGRAGFFVEVTDVSATATVAGITATEDDSATAVDSILGIGTAFHFGEHFSVRLDYQRLIALDDNYYDDEDEVAGTDANIFNLNAVFRF